MYIRKTIRTYKNKQYTNYLLVESVHTLPTVEGTVLRIRKGATPDRNQKEIYKTLKVPLEVMKPVKTWHPQTET